MDLLWHVAEHTIPAALSLLPGRMDSPEARAMLLAVGLQESGFATRRQTKGPARGFYQFEQAGGIAGVLTHPLTKPVIEPVCRLLLYPALAVVCYAAVEHHDVLATCFARLLLWTDMRALPTAVDAQKGWDIYLAQWRPGKPHPAEWPGNFATAWHVVTETGGV